MRNNCEYKTNIIDKNICKNDQSAKMKQALHPKVKRKAKPRKSQLQQKNQKPEANPEAVHVQS